MPRGARVRGFLGLVLWLTLRSMRQYGRAPVPVEVHACPGQVRVGPQEPGHLILTEAGPVRPLL